MANPHPVPGGGKWGISLIGAYAPPLHPREVVKRRTNPYLVPGPGGVGWGGAFH